MTIFLEWVTHGLRNCAACDYLDGMVAPAEEFEVYPGFHNNCDCTLEPIDKTDFWSYLTPKRFFSWKQLFTFIDISFRRVGSMSGLKPFAKDLNAHVPDNMIPHYNYIDPGYIRDKYYFIYGFQAIGDYFNPKSTAEDDIKKSYKQSKNPDNTFHEFGR